MNTQVARLTQDELRELAAQSMAEFDGAGTVDSLRWTNDTFDGINGPRGWVTCNYVVVVNIVLVLC